MDDLNNTNDPLIVIASNRGPFSFSAQKDGTFGTRRGAGGLVTALSALAEQQQVLWVAAAMSDDDRAWSQAMGDTAQNVEGIFLKLVQLDQAAYDQYYNTVANPLLWFIQHQLWNIPRTPSINDETWAAWKDGYVAVNRSFAEAIAETVENVDRPIIIFPQDYHLYLVPYFLRERLGSRVQIQPFIHIPWPGPDAWRVLPLEMRNALMGSLLASDRIGFQTQQDAFNFVQCCRWYLEGAHSYGSRDSITYRGREVKAVAYPISVDVETLEDLANNKETQLYKSQVVNFASDRQLILRVDRIEPSKNILRSIEAYRDLLRLHPEHRGKVQMMAFLVPSRMEVAEYSTYLRDIMAEAGMINAEFSDEIWEPIRIVVGDNYARAVAAMQLFDVLLVNPIADGMNLVAKEGVLVNQRDGVLLLSEQAGVFYELGDQALVVSPFDIYGTVEAMHEALTMPPEQRRVRSEAMRQQVRDHDVRQWFADQVADAVNALSIQSSSDSTPETP